MTLRDVEGVPHTFRIQSRLAPGAGHVMEAIEEGTEGYGYQFKVMGPEESDAVALFEALFARMREALGRRYLQEGNHGLQFAQDADSLRGRVEMDPETQEPVLVVDGRPRSWDEIGQLLLTLEGWNVEIRRLDSIERVPGTRKPGRPSDDTH